MGCQWNMPGIYTAGFTSCDGDPTPPMGIYGASTFHQGDGRTPPAHPAGVSSKCVTSSAIDYAGSAGVSASASVSTSGVKASSSASAMVPGPTTNPRPNSAQGSLSFSSWSGLLGIGIVGAVMLLIV